jgi:7-cyano-7-deazaguanine synthase
MDSTVLLASLRSDGWDVHALTASYGQRHGVELESAREQARIWECASHEIVELDPSFFRSALTDRQTPVPKDRAIMDGIPETYVPARNLVLLSLGAARAESLSCGHVYIAVNAVDYSGYPDCRKKFVEAFDWACREGTRDEIRVHAPFIDMSKADIIRLGDGLCVDFAATHSCYDPDGEGRACGRCDSCVLRRRGFAAAGVVDPTRYTEGVR